MVEQFPSKSGQGGFSVGVIGWQVLTNAVRGGAIHRPGNWKADSSTNSPDDAQDHLLRAACSKLDGLEDLC